MNYIRFAVMIATSTFVMFLLMYFNTFELDHVFFSQTRAWMALLVGAVMAAVMLVFMWGMYRNKALNIGIMAACMIVGVSSLYMVRSQAAVDDVSYMRAMIPHHSIAILTSSRAHIKDPRVRTLADGILETQIKEIGEMESLIEDLDKHPTASGQPDLQAKHVSQ